MAKRKLASLIMIWVILSAGITRAQTAADTLNLDFENLDSTFFPLTWTHTKSTSDTPQRTFFRADSIVKHNGRYALFMQKNTQSAGVFTSKRILALPATGNQITLKGFLKTEDVNGAAGLWLRIDGADGPIAMENMLRQRIQGTNDWMEYTISLDYDPQKAKIAAFGGIIAGVGKSWIDNLNIYINNVDSSSKQLKGHQATEVPLTGRQINDLARLGSLWGFLKYHHQKFTSGNCDADKELLRMLDLIYNSKSKKESDALLTNWLDSLGVPVADKRPELRTEDTMNSRCAPSYNILFNRKYFNKNLIRRTKQILYSNDNCSAGQHYVSKNRLVTSFDQENPYYQVLSPDWSLRLLALFRYWNAIEYFYPYRYLINNWDSVLFSYIDVFSKASSKYEYLLACQKLICEIEDSHARLYPAFFELDGHTNLAPVSISFVQHKPIIDDIYLDAADGYVSNSFHRGDIITKIDNVDIDTLIQQYLPVTSGSNAATRFRDISKNHLLRTKQSTLSLTLQNDSGIKTVTVPAINEHDYYERKFHLLEKEQIALIEDTICYIPASCFDLMYTCSLLKSNNIKRIIVDMRKPTTRQGTIDSFHLFIGMYANSPSPYCAFSSANFCHPGYFPIMSANLINNTFGPVAQLSPFKLFILVDENVQSSAECLTMALQKVPGSLTIGTRTAGTDGNVTTLPLPGNVITWFTSLGTYYPDGTETQRVGVKIDKLIERTIEGARTGKDELIEFAKRY